MRKYYITTPIYYVNDIPHIGHSYTTIASDILARWKRLNNFDVFFLTGTDEHGAKIAAAAKEKGKTPKELVDEMSARFKEAWKLLNISYTDFIRTTEARQDTAVQKFVQILFDKGLIFKKKYEALYCTGCERFYSEKDLDENGCCHLHKTKPVLQAEENYFFKLSSFQNALLERITDKNHKEYIEIQPEERRNEIIGKLKLGLEDISVSRAALEWGIPVPFDQKQTVYVWVDALINYITGIGYPSDEKTFNKYWPADVHLMAKDILWFHSVIWPALLMGAGFALPKKVSSHGFFTSNGIKMSKSLGNVISPQELVDKFGVDAARYLAVTLIPFGPDGDISWNAFTLKYNTDLANNLGNLISRTIKMAEKYFNLEVPNAQNGLELTKKAAEILNKDFSPAMDAIHPHKAAEALQNAITLVNQQIENDAPWKLAKTEPEKLPACINSYLQATALIIIHLLPFMPEISEKIWKIIGANGNITDTAKKYFADKTIPENGFISAGAKLENPGILFPRIVQK
ncbi:methionine--tRNA ligase [Endomicrobium proavitum]|uniref:Methionine--tRNA ligase n=1 Tax=Endomicrobium proavitum TaxID=1408281 RepID=A0A0G3WHS1_9BACT|nr:methionine--tRNA ligase [Endomicrobium proavitum]AKL97442.1 Methionine-tRNA ligase [Endomicrobium proavitum]